MQHKHIFDYYLTLNLDSIGYYRTQPYQWDSDKSARLECGRYEVLPPVVLNERLK